MTQGKNNSLVREFKKSSFRRQRFFKEFTGREFTKHSSG